MAKKRSTAAVLALLMAVQARQAASRGNAGDESAPEGPVMMAGEDGVGIASIEFDGDDLVLVLTDGTVARDRVRGEDGVGVASVAFDGDDLALSLTDGEEVRGRVRGEDGVGIASVAFDGDDLALALTDGEEVRGRVRGEDGVGIASVAFDGDDLALALTDGEEVRGRVRGEDGVGIASVEFDGDDLVLVLTDGKKVRGRVRGDVGDAGAGIKDIRIDKRGHLIITLSTGEKIDAGRVVGKEGKPGKPGKPGGGGGGLSAYEIAVLNGFEGTEAEWLASLQGADGADAEFPDGATEGQVLTADAAGDPIWADAASGVSEPTIPAFTDLTGQATETLIESGAVTVTGDAGSVWPLTVRGDGSPQVQVAGGDWAQHAAATPGDAIKLRLTTSADALTARTATLYAPGVSRAWLVTTMEAWNPNALTGLTLWLDADDAATITQSGGAVSEWRDKSANELALSASGSLQPSYSGDRWSGSKPSIAFLNSRLTMTGGVSGTDNWSIFAVHNPTETGGALRYIMDASAGRLIVSHATTVEPGGMSYFAGSWVAHTNAVTGQQIGGWVLSPADGRLYRDGVEILTGGNYNQVALDGTIAVGNVHNGTSSPYRGELAEFIVYRGALAAAARQQVEGYLAHKWGLESSLPADHPYKSSAP